MTRDLPTLYPPLALNITSPSMTLRMLRDADLPEFAALLRRPIFDDPHADHVFPWYRKDPDMREREALQYQWSLRAGVRPEKWEMSFGVFVGGELVGMQDIRAEDLAVRRTVESGSWLTADAHGRGLGSHMRRMAVVFAFDYLGAARAQSGAYLGNDSSARVSRSCGYRENGTTVHVEDGVRLVAQQYLVTPETFVRKGVTIEVAGWTASLRAMLGVRENPLA